MSAETPSETRSELPRVLRNVRRIGMIFSALVILAATLAGLWWYAKYKAAHDRAAWKVVALERLAALSITNAEILRELEELRANLQAGNDARWAHERVLLMKDGDYIIFANRHGANNGFVDHLFLGHSSDGRWLYSTYHFCNSMAAVLIDNPPASIAEFERRYAVREFDGKSDLCLQHTWPPE